MFKKFNEKIIEAMVITDFGMPKITEVFLMLVAFWWAFILALPVDTFAISGTYDIMLGLASEGIWSLAFLSIGALQLIGIIIHNKRLSLAGLMIGTIVWLFVGTMMLISAFASTGAGIYILMSGLSASVYFFKGVGKE